MTLTFARHFPEWRRITDRYFWMTALIIARNAIAREYQNAFLGVVWTLILPLIQVVIFAIIMPLIMLRPIENYPLYLVASFPLWSFISTALVQSSNAILNQAETIKRCVVSSVVFPIADVMKHGYNYLVAFSTMYLFFVMFYGEFDPVALLFPLFFVPVFVAVLAFSVAMAYVAPYVRDVGYVMHMLVTILFWFTPVVYPLDVVPAEYREWFALNPLYVLMHPVQQVVFAHALPTMGEICAAWIVAGASVVVSFLLYRLCRRNYVYYL